ncbi:GxxExxY protein [Candidatus Wolfebacteria bacterium]|nr:GxxExxY protein [Candidatus Wolfebacteria bacterium]
MPTAIFPGEVFADKNDGRVIGKNWIDFIIDDKIVVDLKAKPFITRDDYYQMQRYLRLENLKLGLIINFQSKYLRPKRILNSQYSHILA